MGRFIFVSDDETFRSFVGEFLVHMGYAREEPGYGVVVLSMQEDDAFGFVISDPQTLAKYGREIFEKPPSFTAIPTICVNCNWKRAHVWWTLTTGREKSFTKGYSIRELAKVIGQQVFSTKRSRSSSHSSLSH